MVNSIQQPEPEWANRSDPPFFRKIFVLQYGKDFSLLKEFTDEIVFVATGYEAVEDLPKIITDKLSKFDPVQDAIVAVGKVNINFISGIALQNMWPNMPIWIAVYTTDTGNDRPDYRWIHIKLEDV